MKFEIRFLPARYGDCIWIAYGTNDETNNILIDGGTAGTKADIKELLDQLPADKRHFELIVVTHIDRDHIEGVLSLMQDETLSFTAGDFWFNGWNHLPGNENEEALGAVQGEKLTAAILKREFKWNEQFNRKAVVIPASGDLPVINLAGGMKITLLSPQIQNLADLKPKWIKELQAADLVPGFGALPVAEVIPGIESLGALPDINMLNAQVFKEDEAEANGSSIAFLAEFGGKTIFFGGDSFPGIVLASLNKLFVNEKAPVDLVKLSHHASAHNTSPALIEKFDCEKYIISTNGSIFHHPAQVTIARVIKRANKNVELMFNYLSDDNKVWDSDLLKLQHKYKATYPQGDGISVKLI